MHLPSAIFGVIALASLFNPRLRAEDVANSAEADLIPWGVSSSASSFRNHAEWFPKMSGIGAPWIRLFPEWRGLQPSPETWKWEATDAMVQAATSHGVRINGILMGCTPWSKDGGHTFPMNQLPAWSSYVSSVVGRYKDQVQYWEVWNEGNGGFNDARHTTADYASLAAATYAAAKKASSRAQVGLTVASFDAPYLRDAIRSMAKAGMPGHFDFLCIHPYEITDGVREGSGDIAFLGMTRLLRDVLQRHSPERANAEIWITELGQRIDERANHRLTDEQAAQTLAKVYTMAIAQGIRRTQWFEAQDPAGEEPGFGLLRRDGSPRATFATLKLLIASLGAVPKYQGWIALGEGGRGYGFVFDGAAGPALAAWMPGGTTDQTTTFTTDAKVIDLVSGRESLVKAGQPLRLTESPILVTGAPVRGNPSHDFPWGGDHSAAKSVSIQLGKADGSHGLIAVDRKSNPEHTFPDGSIGVRVKSDQSVRFYAHPTFASLEAREYYVRLTVRRLGPGNVGMNLQYEIADTQGRIPYKNRGQWFSVSEDSDWQTHTWHLTDACFSKMWGYDFSFRPEQSVPFVIGKVEVSTTAF